LLSLNIAGSTVTNVRQTSSIYTGRSDSRHDTSRDILPWWSQTITSRWYHV